MSCNCERYRALTADRGPEEVRELHALQAVQLQADLEPKNAHVAALRAKMAEHALPVLSCVCVMLCGPDATASQKAAADAVCAILEGDKYKKVWSGDVPPPPKVEEKPKEEEKPNEAASAKRTTTGGGKAASVAEGAPGGEPSKKPEKPNDLPIIKIEPLKRKSEDNITPLSNKDLLRQKIEMKKK